MLRACVIAQGVLCCTVCEFVRFETVSWSSRREHTYVRASVNLCIAHTYQVHCVCDSSEHCPSSLDCIAYEVTCLLYSANFLSFLLSLLASGSSRGRGVLLLLNQIRVHHQWYKDCKWQLCLCAKVVAGLSWVQSQWALHHVSCYYKSPQLMAGVGWDTL